MNEMLEKGNLIYRSMDVDKGLRNFPLISRSCFVKYYKTYELSPFDNLICSYLYEMNCKQVSFEQIGYELGFDVVDNPKVDSFYDEAEVNILKMMLQEVADFGLILFSQNSISLTKLGELALKSHKKHSFYEASTDIYELQGFKDEQGNRVNAYPFVEELEVEIDLRNIKKISYSEDENFTSIVSDNLKNNLAQEIQLQTSKEIEIYEANMSSNVCIQIKPYELNVELYTINDKYKLSFSVDGKECCLLNDLFELESNLLLKERKIEWALYSKIMNDESAKLNYSLLSPFEDIIEIDRLICDSRLEWSDEQLRKMIFLYCSADDWHNVTQYCDIAVLEKIANEYSDMLDWSKLTIRMSDQFLVNNSLKFPWETTLLTARKPLSEKLITHFLKEYKFEDGIDDEQWDWEEIIPVVGFDFIKEHLDDIPFDLSSVTRELDEEHRMLVCQHINAAWDWDYITNEFPKEFLIENIEVLCEKINLQLLIKRIFTDIHICEIASQSNDLLSAIRNTNILSISYNVNHEAFVWKDKVISFFERAGLLDWNTTRYQRGFCSNPNITWDYEFFSKYNNKITTDESFNYLSSIIQDVRIIEDFPHFKWNWTILSKNKVIYDNPEYVINHLNKLDSNLILLNCSSELVETYYYPLNVKSLLNNEGIRNKITDCVSVEFIKQNINDNWNWQQITKRVYKTLKISIIGNNIWKDKWDWFFLSQNLELDDILKYAEEYADKWNWNTVLNRLDDDSIHNDENLSKLFKILSSSDHTNEWEILSNRLSIDKILLFANEYLENWNWGIIVERFNECLLLDDNILSSLNNILNRLNEKCSLWASITSKLSTNNLIDMVDKFPDYPWDLNAMYSRDDFNAKSYIENHIDAINWTAFSSSKSVNKYFEKGKSNKTRSLWIKILKDRLENPNYHWDFYELSHLSNVLNEPKFFELEKPWDWIYISANANWIFLNKVDKDSDYYFYKYKKHLSFNELSNRTDIHLNEEIIEKFITEDWNWEYLVNNNSVEYSIKFINDHSDKPWDWKVLSEREDLTSEFVENHKQENWDWFLVTSHNFIPSITLLKYILDSEGKINWTNISENENITLEFINQYTSYIDWNSFVSNNKSFEEIASITFLKENFKYIPWNLYNLRVKSNITNETLEAFASVLDWKNISSSQQIKFSTKLINRYENKWYWDVLLNNLKFKEDIPEFEVLFPNGIKAADFIKLLKKEVETPHIYHFTHLYNAIEVIKSRKILSRNRAKELGLLQYDSAGSVIQRSCSAHPYARFYYRPCTPTQYYNEALGADSKLGYFNKKGDWKSKYTKAKNLGLPKCPIPVFFRFDIDEIISKMPNNCYYSDRNMQANEAHIYKILNNPYQLSTSYLYKTMEDAFKKAISTGDYDRITHDEEINKVKLYSQQEFLVENEFDFSNLDSLKIICYDEEYTSILKQIFKGDPICDKIVSGFDIPEQIFENENRRIIIRNNIDSYTLSTDFRDYYYYKIIGNNIEEINFDFSYADVFKVVPNKEIYLRGNIKWSDTKIPFNIYFVDPQARTKEWLIYSNLNDVSMKRKFVLEKEIHSYINHFVPIMEKLPINLSQDLFYTHMINSHHGIAHTSRVLLTTFILANLMRLSDSEIEASCIAAIIHDLGKRSDVEGAEHGYNSMILYKEKISSLVMEKELQERILNAVRYHSVEDKDCPLAVQNDIIWKVLKDADALDRSRFGGKGCDKSYLRLDIYETYDGQNIIDLTSYLPGWTKGLTWDNPYEEIVERIHNYVS